MSPAASERAVVVLALLCGAGLLFAFDPAAEGLERHHLTKEVALVVGAALLLSAALPTLRFDRLDAALGALVVVELAATAFATDQDLAARGAMVVAATVAIALAVRTLGIPARATLEAGLLALTSIVAAWALAEAYGLVPRLSLDRYAPGITLGQRNHVAHVSAVVLALAAGRWLRSPGAMHLGALTLLAAAIAVTRSRTGWLAALAGVGVALALVPIEGRSRGARLGLRTGLVGAVGLGAALPFVVRPALPWRDAAAPYLGTASRLFELDAGSGQGRLLQWRTSLALVRAHPLLGVGPGHWAVHYPAVAGASDPTVHEDAWAPTSRLLTGDVAAWLVERGTLGLMALAVALGLLALTAWRGRSTDAAAHARLAALAALAVVLAADVSLQIALGAVALVAVVPARTTGARAPAAPVALAWVLLLALAVPRTLERAVHAHLRPDADDATLLELARDPFDVASRFRLADEALFRGDCPAAEPVLDRILTLRPELPRAVAAREACSVGR